MRAPACAAAALQTAGDVSGPHEELIFLSLLFGQAHPLVVTTLSQSFNYSQYDRGQTRSAGQSPQPPSVYLKSLDGRGYGPSDELSIFVYVNPDFDISLLLICPTSLFLVCWTLTKHLLSDTSLTCTCLHRYVGALFV